MQIPRRTLTFLGFNATGDLGDLTAYTSRRAGTVWFPRSPPLKPPSIPQIRMRDRFRLAAQAWKALPNVQRQRWNNAARRAHLYIHGYNLWVWYQITRDRPGLSTIERLSSLTLNG